MIILKNLMVTPLKVPYYSLYLETELSCFFHLLPVPGNSFYSASTRKLGALVFKPFSYSSRPWSGRSKPGSLASPFSFSSELAFVGDSPSLPKLAVDWLSNRSRWFNLIRHQLTLFTFYSISLGFLQYRPRLSLFSRFWGTVFRFIGSISFVPPWGFGFSSPEEISLNTTLSKIGVFLNSVPSLLSFHELEI